MILTMTFWNLSSKYFVKYVKQYLNSKCDLETVNRCNCMSTLLVVLIVLSKLQKILNEILQLLIFKLITINLDVSSDFFTFQWNAVALWAWGEYNLWNILCNVLICIVYFGELTQLDHRLHASVALVHSSHNKPLPLYTIYTIITLHKHTHTHTLLIYIYIYTVLIQNQLLFGNPTILQTSYNYTEIL